jgi:hypothetical protein
MSPSSRRVPEGLVVVTFRLRCGNVLSASGCVVIAFLGEVA